MFQALFNSLSGLFSFSRSLDTVSNNVSNMNTPGFRGSDSFFENVNGGRGTMVTGEGLRTGDGEQRQTGNATDLAIDGTGYFVLRDPQTGATHYTRAGQFEFKDGILVDKVSGFQVMAYEDGGLVPFDYNTLRTLPPEPTSLVRLSGAFASGSATETIQMNVFDSNGVSHALTVTLTKDQTVTAPPTYVITVTDADGDQVGPATLGKLRFNADGTIQNRSEFTFRHDFDGDGTQGMQSITLDFGAGFGGVHATPGGGGVLSASVTDGHGALGVRELSFDQNGVLQLVYSATERRTGPQIALAAFQNETSLEMAGGRMLTGMSMSGRTIGRAGDGVFGTMNGGFLEMANVDLTAEFADMIIIQRGYQASSRVMTVSNEMIEQLYNSTRGG